MIGNRLQMSDRIKNTDELEFVIFCIENLALRLKTDAEHIYTALAESSSFLYDYIVAHYGVLHTQDKEYKRNFTDSQRMPLKHRFGLP